jgi:hypothetical protein
LLLNLPKLYTLPNLPARYCTGKGKTPEENKRFWKLGEVLFARGLATTWELVNTTLLISARNKIARQVPVYKGKN